MENKTIDFLSEVDENEWDHMHDCVVDVTYKDDVLKLSREELLTLFHSMPRELQLDAFRFGMNDTGWREEFIEWLKNNKSALEPFMEKGSEAMKKFKNIPINIWDDFADDDFLDDGEVQETFAYVENDEIPNEYAQQFLDAIHDYAVDYLKIKDDGVDSQVKFSLMRWEIEFKNLTHDRLGRLVKELNEANFEFEGIPFKIYSES